MGFGFLSPLFFAGAALIAIPWLVHQIRKPERKTLRFSSLMFVPVVKKETLERRKIQHLLLMLLRMLLLALLAFAFTRPYWEAQANGKSAERPLVRHVVLLDTSFSMRAGGWFADAQSRANKIVAGLASADRVAVVTFDRAPHVIAGLSDPEHSEVGTAARARQAIDGAQPTWEGTSYLPALQTAEKLLIPNDAVEPAANEKLYIDLITDYQHAGMPEPGISWKLSPRVQLNTVEIGKADAPNYSIVDLAVEETKFDELRIRGKIKNWTAPAKQPLDIKLFANGKEAETKQLSIKPGNATQVIFTLPWTGAERVEGYLQLAGDSLDADNQYFFSYNPRQKHAMLVVDDTSLTLAAAATAAGNAPAVGVPASRFVELTVPAEADLPWAPKTVESTSLAATLASKQSLPELLVATDLTGPTQEIANALINYVRQGGELLLTLNGQMDTAALNQNLLAQLGLRSEGPRRASQSDAIYSVLSWIDLDHKIFMPFRESRFSDFSAIHYFNFQQLAVIAPPSGVESARVIAKFDDERPAMLESRIGEGRIILWTFSPDLTWSNFPKKASFVPVLHETLGYLTPASHKSGMHRVGEAITPPLARRNETPKWEVEAPGAANWSGYTNAAGLLQKPGYLRWRNSSAPPTPIATATATRSTSSTIAKGATTSTLNIARGLTPLESNEQVDAVNIDPRESDPLRVTIPEFTLRLTTTPEPPAAPTKPVPTTALGEQITEKHEYGPYILGLLLLFLIVESWYANRLAVNVNRSKVEA